MWRVFLLESLMALVQLPRQISIDADGQPRVGAGIYVYEAGTDTLAEIFTTNAYSVEQANPATSLSDGLFPAFFINPADYPTHKIVVKDADGLTIYSQDNIPSSLLYSDITQELIGTKLYPQTANELVAAATPVNYQYEPGNVDRYATNETPGTTDMTPAFNAAYLVAQQTGCGVTYGATAPYLLSSPVNCTQKRGIVTRDISSKKQANAQPSIIIGHTGHGFDLSASTEMSFHDMVAENATDIVPNTLFFMARNSVGSGADYHRFYNIRTGPHCKFRHVFYNYGSEQSLHIGNSIYNSQPGSTCYNHNCTNPALYTSSFMTIATGAMSNVRHVHMGCDYFNVGDSGSSNEVAMSVERTGNLTILGGMMYAPNGLAYIRVDGTIGSNFLTIIGCRGEANAAAATLAAIAVRTTAATGSDVHAHWIIENMSLDTTSGGYLLDCDATSHFLDLNVRGCVTSSGNHLLLHTASYSIFEHHQQAVTGLSGGTISNCKFVGNRGVVALSGTDSANLYDDMLTGIRGQSSDTASQASTACTGAITAVSTWAARKNGKAVTLSLPVLSATSTAAASYSYATALPTGMRPAADRRFPCIISDNGAVLNQPGFVQVSTAGVITVFKDVVGTANFTAAAGAGLPAAQDFTWAVA
jgi:hypothetical protein